MRTTWRASSGVTTCLADGKRANHIDIQMHFAHKLIQNGDMLLVRVPTASQLADIFTKDLRYQQSGQACVKGILGETLKPT